MNGESMSFAPQKTTCEYCDVPIKSRTLLPPIHGCARTGWAGSSHTWEVYLTLENKSPAMLCERCTLISAQSILDSVQRDLLSYLKSTLALASKEAP